MSTTKVPLSSLLIKPAGPDCNLACEYCFYLPKAEMFPETQRHRMTTRVLKETLRQALTQCEQGLSISWQGGEPTLLGLDFFKRAVEYQKAFGRGKSVSNAFQTNGVLLNRKWIDFFKRYNFLVGLSLDGPQHVHDHYRRFARGAGSWAKVSANAKRMVAKGVSVNAMTCLTDYSAKFPEEIYRFNKELGLVYMQFIPIVEWEQEEDRTLAPFAVTADQYGDFLCRIFDLWCADFRGGQPTTSIRLFESIFFTCLGHPPPQCTFRKSCGQYLVVEHNGDVFSCDFYVDPEWRLGNVMRGRLEAMLNSRRQNDFRRMKRSPAACDACPHEAFCHGGCPKDRVFLDPTAKNNYFCTAYKKVFAYALPVLNQLASRWRPNTA